MFQKYLQSMLLKVKPRGLTDRACVKVRLNTQGVTNDHNAVCKNNGCG
jgi:hypothetical protein